MFHLSSAKSYRKKMLFGNIGVTSAIRDTILVFAIMELITWSIMKNDKMKTTTCSNVAEKSVLLQTGRAQVVNNDDQRYSSFARFMFDGGSMKSYVTRCLEKKA